MATCKHFVMRFFLALSFISTCLGAAALLALGAAG
jgi:hypothetical protein